MNREIWKPVIGYEGYYEVSDQGRVRSSEKPVKCKGNGISTRNSKVLKPQVVKGSYFRVRFTVDKVVTVHSVHRLVAEAFIDNYSHGKDIHHINKDGFDNRVENLQCVDKEEHMRIHNEPHHTKKICRVCGKPFEVRASRSYQKVCSRECLKSYKSQYAINKMKRIRQVSLNGDVIGEWDSIQEAARQTGFRATSICAVCNGRAKSHKGYFWSYIEVNGG